MKGDVSEVGSQIQHQAVGSAKAAMAATAHHQGKPLPPCLLNGLNNLSDIKGLEHQLGIARCSIAVKELRQRLLVARLTGMQGHRCHGDRDAPFGLAN